MDAHRSLLEIFDRVVAGDEPDPAAALRAAGHAELPAHLLDQALVGYCDTAPIEVAEQLEPYVAAVTAQAGPDPATGLELLDHAPAAGVLPDDLDFGAGAAVPDDLGPVSHGGIDPVGTAPLDATDPFDSTGPFHANPVDDVHPAAIHDDSVLGDTWHDHPHHGHPAPDHFDHPLDDPGDA